jgi:translation elongation factor EF-1beta
LAHKELDSRKPKDPEIDMDNFREDIIAEIKNNKIVSNK